MWCALQGGTAALHQPSVGGDGESFGSTLRASRDSLRWQMLTHARAAGGELVKEEVGVLAFKKGIGRAGGMHAVCSAAPFAEAAERCGECWG